MENDPTLDQVMHELEQVRRELREIKAQDAASSVIPPNENSEKGQKVISPDGERIDYPTEHPHIYINPAIHKGEPTIRGSAISVRTIVERTRLGDSPEEIIKGYPHLNLAMIYDALSYYYDHTEEIERHIRENEEALWRALHPAST